MTDYVEAQINPPPAVRQATCRDDSTCLICVPILTSDDSH